MKSLLFFLILVISTVSAQASYYDDDIDEYKLTAECVNFIKNEINVSKALSKNGQKVVQGDSTFKLLHKCLNGGNKNATMYRVNVSDIDIDIEQSINNAFANPNVDIDKLLVTIFSFVNIQIIENTIAYEDLW